MRQYNIGFILEQALGHVTHAKNLMANVPHDESVTPHWGLVPFEVSGRAAKIPIYKSNWTVRSGLRARGLLAQMAHSMREAQGMREAPASKLDVLFFHTQVPAVLCTDWIRRIPSVVSLDATPLQYDELGASYSHETGPSWLERIKWRMNRDCFAATRQIVAWTEWTKAGLVKGYGVDPDKVAVIPPGVTVRDWVSPKPRSDPSTRSVQSASVKVLFVGGDLERKGGRLLLQAFRAVAQSTAVAQQPGIELHLVTKEKLDPEPGLFVYNNVKPNSDFLKQLYWASDIFCLPTLGDCLPMVLSEAGAAGLPLISTRLAAIPEVAIEGETGLLVPPGDAEALTVALRTLVEQPELRARLGARAALLVAERFDSERNTQMLLDLLKLVADRSTAQRTALKTSQEGAHG